MSDYLFMLDSHLDAAQNRAVGVVQQLATAAGMNAWLTGGAMRDMLRGAPIRDLDFTVEHDAVKMGKALSQALGGEVISEDPLKRGVEVRLPGNITLSVSNARTEKYSRPGGKPQIAPATIHADLARRDFTINAIALSLTRGSRGLLVDPCNGQADLANRELRATNSYAFFDDPGRIYRLFRFQHVFGLTVAPRTQSQLENALLENYQELAPASVLAAEIRACSQDPNAVAMLEGLDSHGLLKPLSAALTGAKLNAAGLAKFGRLAHGVLPSGYEGGWLAFLTILTEKLNSRERAEVVRAFGLTPEETAVWKKLDAQMTRLEDALKAPRLHKASQVWEVLREVPSDEVLLVLYRSAVRVVQDRIRAYFERYLPLAQEVTDEDVLATGAKPGTPKFARVRRAMITTRLNARPRKVEIAEPEPAPVIAAGGGRSRG
jgi:tRNA nucleotidyltransferase (CCA-adding enzyme)